MTARKLTCITFTIAAALQCTEARTQHLWWNLEGQTQATCLYGEITVLATQPGHLLLRGQLASWRAGGRLLRHPAQRPEGTPHDLLHLGYVARTAPEGHGGRSQDDLQPLRRRGDREPHPHAVGLEDRGYVPVLCPEARRGRSPTRPTPATTFTTAARRSGCTAPRSPAPMAARKAWPPSAAA